MCGRTRYPPRYWSVDSAVCVSEGPQAVSRHTNELNRYTGNFKRKTQAEITEFFDFQFHKSVNDSNNSKISIKAPILGMLNFCSKKNAEV